MTKLSSEVKHDTILESIFGLRFKPKLLNEVAFGEKKNGTDIYKDNYHEIEVIEVPVSRKMLFQFNKPVKLDFS